MTDEVAANVPVFKKRGKATLKRKQHSSSDEEAETSLPHLSVAEILRQRKLGRVKRSTIETSAASQNDASISVAAVQGNEENDIDKMKNRFVAQTGQVVGLYDKQMNDYIDAKMAEYRNQSGDTPTRPTTNARSESPMLPENISINGASRPDKLSVTAGKLMEVDLGGVSRHVEEEAAKAAKPVKVRLGRDGKPWRPRKRRNSENMARDALIDNILKENSLSRFQDAVPTSNAGKNASTPAGNEYVDEDRVFENFKSNYQDPERRNVRKPVAKNQQDQVKGPKMGGSKNTRRAVEEEQKTQLKKP